MNGIMDELRTQTADLHASAEHQAFQQRMAKGALTGAEYAAWLGQMLCIHGTLEPALAAAVEAERRLMPALRALPKTPLLREDLVAAGSALEPEPLASTAEILRDIQTHARGNSLALLGYHYVLEGSTNGNRFIARRLLPALGLDAGRGGRYLDAYGERQREVWAQFKAEMGAESFSADERATLVGAAKDMFRAIGKLSAELSASAA